jgi:hypothetical protein
MEIAEAQLGCVQAMVRREQGEYSAQGSTLNHMIEERGVLNADRYGFTDGAEKRGPAGETNNRRKA